VHKQTQWNASILLPLQVVITTVIIKSKQTSTKKISWIKDQRTKQQGNKETAKQWQNKESHLYTLSINPYKCITMTELGVKCPLVYLQVCISNLPYFATFKTVSFPCFFVL